MSLQKIFNKGLWRIKFPQLCEKASKSNLMSLWMRKCYKNYSHYYLNLVRGGDNSRWSLLSHDLLAKPNSHNIFYSNYLKIVSASEYLLKAFTSQEYKALICPRNIAARRQGAWSRVIEIGQDSQSSCKELSIFPLLSRRIKSIFSPQR